MKIGLIGAQNSHSRGFCEAINKKRPWEDVEIGFVYGADDPAEAERLCEEFGVFLCGSEEEVIEKSDAVAITYRKGSMHYSPAMKVLKAKKPLFCDKPFTTNLAEAEEIAMFAAENDVLLSGGSAIKCSNESLAKIKESIKPGSTVVVSYAADPGSEYDGYWFYGSHSAEICLELCERNFKSVSAFKNGDAVISSVVYSDKVCVLSTSPGAYNLTVSVTDKSGTTTITPVLYDPDAAALEFVEMIKSKKAPRGYEFYVKSVELTGKIIESFEGAHS